MNEHFGQIAVERVGLTTVAAPQEDGARTLWAAVGVWADLSAVRTDGHLGRSTGADLDALMAVDAYLLPDSTRMAVVVSPGMPVSDIPDGAEDAEDSDGVDEAAEADDPGGADLAGDGFATDASRPETATAAVLFSITTTGADRYTLVLPTTAVALVMALSTTPAGVQMVLVDAPAPDVPESVALAPSDIAAAVLIPAEIVHDLLCGLVNRGLHAPLPTISVQNADLVAPTVVDSMRAMLWSLIAGTATGQGFTFERLVGLGLWAYEAATRPDPDIERIAALFEIADQAQVLSMDAATSAEVSIDLTHLPLAMAPMAGLATECVDPKVLAALDSGSPFAEVAHEVGLRVALPALGVLVAARAAAVAAHPDHQGASASLLLATWMDDGTSQEPWWVLPATKVAQAAHDVTVVTDLLCDSAAVDDTQDSDAWSPLLVRYVHTLAEAVLTLDMDEDTFRAALAGLDVRPANFSDAADLAVLLLSEALASVGAEDGQCPACAASTPLHQVGWTRQRLAAASAALLPLLADTDAADQGLVVGDSAWVTRREQFLQHWLVSAAA